MKARPLFAFVALTATLVACDGLREALTAHVDVVARAGSQELSVTRLADLMGQAKLQVPTDKQTATILTDLWVNYQQLGQAAARGDSLTDPKNIDKALEGVSASIRVQRFMEQVAKSFSADTGSEAGYNASVGGLLAARHILLSFPQGATPAQHDSVKKAAEALRPQVNDANFADMAKKHSSDPGSGQNGGDLGVFPKGAMVGPFGNAVAALKPGEISAPVETQFGFHIIQRLTWERAKTAYVAQFAQSHSQVAESTYMAKIDSNANVKVKDGAPALAKAAALAISQHRDDNGTLATYNGGALTTGRFVMWLETFPPQARVAQQMQQVPDSLIRDFIKGIARRDLVLAKADSAKVTLTAEESNGLHKDFGSAVQQIWQLIGVDPKALADSAKSGAERERLAAARVEAYLDRVMAGTAQPIPVPPPLAAVLNMKYESKVNAAGIDRAVERAKVVRLAADSVRASQQPRSQVPIPGVPPAGVPQQAPQQVPQQAPPQAPPGATKTP
ncbi:MAG: PpiC-type peptidyl-prolyl cis-trans isomerase [Gemmatimonadetes bacterium]|nr:PpiC-type peptidyl-prolyl cis-trans isomerase [Gemmatimonadota bacterium]